MTSMLVTLAVGVTMFTSSPTGGVTCQSVTVSASNTTVNRGGSVDFTLMSFDAGSGTLTDIAGGYLKAGTADIVPLVLWKVVSKSLVVVSDIDTVSPSFVGRVSTPSTHVMRISNVTFTDQGKDFIFRMTYMDKTSRTATSAKYQLNVTVAPVAVAPLLSSILNVVEGYNVTLNCVFEGLPLVAITWIDRSTRGVNSTQQNTAHPNTGLTTSSQSITITNIQSNESGVYFCQATNRGGQSDQRADVQIQNYKPIITSFAPDDTRPLAGTRVTFTCSASGNPNPTAYHYFFKGIHKMTSASNQWSPQLNNCSTSSGSYSCVAVNTLGNSTAGGIYLTVGDSPRIYQIPASITANKSDPNVTLSCYAVGCPPPSVAWKKVGYPSFYSPGNILAFSSVVRTNGGEYKCTATNQHGSANSHAVVTVNYPPVVVTQVSTIKACIGEQISIPCKADAVPMPTVNISNSVGTVVSFSIQGTVFYNVSVINTHFGEYICYATNMFGNDRRSTTVNRRDRTSTPIGVAVISGEANSLVVKWNAPVCIPNSLNASYVIFIVHPTTNIRSNVTASCNSYPCQLTISGLEGNVNYLVSIAAVDGNGQIGDQSQPHEGLSKPLVLLPDKDKMGTDDNVDGAVVGASVGAVILLLIVVAISLFYCKKRAQSNKGEVRENGTTSDYKFSIFNSRHNSYDDPHVIEMKRGTTHSDVTRTDDAPGEANDNFACDDTADADISKQDFHKGTYTKFEELLVKA